MSIGEYEFEPVPGLPEDLPRGEQILWQGSPRWWSLAVHAFRVRLVAIWFAGMAALAALDAAAGGTPAVVSALLSVVVPGVFAIALLSGLAWVNAKAAIFTITTHRIILRFGVALTMSVNLPFDAIASASVRVYRDGSGDIPLVTNGKRINYVVMWPFVRPFRLMQPQPMLRAIPDAASVSRLLADALANVADRPLRVVADEAQRAGGDGRLEVALS